jgi:SAM-dependent methyltransferase
VILRLYEIAYRMGDRFLPVLYQKARRDLGYLVRQAGGERLSILDVGGRKSPYTIGLRADIILLDLPRESEIQRSLHLGVDETILSEIKRRRSNIQMVVLEDMTRCTLPSESVDGVVCVEVIEHVRAAEEFVAQIHRVLKPWGWLYLTTPNGDYIRNEPPNHNPDHVRHYTRMDLSELLSRQFAAVDVTYGVKTGKYRYVGLRSFSLRRPTRLLQSMVGNLINAYESRNLAQQPRRTAHLFAIAWKPAPISAAQARHPER